MRYIVVFLSLAITFITNSAALASDAAFFKGIEGQWSGPGEIVAGKYKGTKFVCTFDGSNPKKDIGMIIDGTCRVGVFSQKMSAHITKKAGKYKGAFLDGAKGEGMDVTGGRYTQNRIIVDILRNELKGVMVVNLNDKNQMKGTISVRHNGKLIPVIGMNLSRLDSKSVTGSVN